jgi:hypothetical protein
MAEPRRWRLDGVLRRGYGHASTEELLVDGPMVYEPTPVVAVEDVRAAIGQMRAVANAAGNASRVRMLDELAVRLGLRDEDGSGR